jgi:glycosyltransferase involved in cell wall biosynthesis
MRPISIVSTVRNEERNIADLLDSLLSQEGEFEIIVADAYSDDSTRDIVRTYAEKDPRVRLFLWGGTRGEGRNFGVARARHADVAFIDGDNIAMRGWIARLSEALESAEVVAGTTVQRGYEKFAHLERVELYHRGFDVTYPSCNLAYRKALFQRIGGFDTAFVTAEDIDLNYRAVEAGARIVHVAEAVVEHKTRPNFFAFFKQAFWNGFGRKQLTLKHGGLWSQYKPEQMFRSARSLWGVARFAFAVLGYLACKVYWTAPSAWKR